MTARKLAARVVHVGVFVLTGPKTLKSTVPETVEVPGVRVTVAVSKEELPRAIGVGETDVEMAEDTTVRVSPLSPQEVETKFPLAAPAGL